MLAVRSWRGSARRHRTGSSTGRRMRVTSPTRSRSNTKRQSPASTSGVVPRSSSTVTGPIDQELGPDLRSAVDLAGPGAALPVEDLGEHLDGVVLVHQGEVQLG